MNRQDVRSIAKLLYETYQEHPYTPWDEVVARITANDRIDETPQMVQRWMRTAESIPDAITKTVEVLRGELNAERAHNELLIEKVAGQADVIRTQTGVLQQISLDSTDEATRVQARVAADIVRPFHYQDWKWICEYCYTRAYTNTLPASWDLIFQSAVCYDCKKRMAMDGGLYEVKGGAYAEVPDPRTYHQPPRR